MRRVFLRVASAVTALFALGHSLGVFSPPPPGAAGMVATAMKTVPLDLLGAQRTYWDLFHGYGVLIIAMAIFLAVHLWMLSLLEARQARPLLYAVAAVQLVFAIVGFSSFFWAPGLFNAVSAGCTLAAALL